jgi:hypothetical protein
MPIDAGESTGAWGASGASQPFLCFAPIPLFDEGTRASYHQLQLGARLYW